MSPKGGAKNGSTPDLSACPTSTEDLTVAAAFPNFGAKWNDYVENTEARFYDAADSLCNADGTIDGGTRNSEFAGINSCLHGGVHRKVVISDINSCDGLEMTDTLEAFNWLCVDRGASVEFYSAGLKEDKQLATLLNDDGDGWRENSVLLKNAAGCELKTSAPVNGWWSNAVHNLNDLDNTTVGDANTLGIPGVSGVDASKSTASGPLVAYILSAPSEIYTFTEDTQLFGFHIEASKIAMVVYPGKKLIVPSSMGHCAVDGTFTAGSGCLIGANSQNHLWLEGTYDVANFAYLGVMVLGGIKHSKLWNMSIQNNSDATKNGLLFYGGVSSYNLIHGLRINNISGDGIYAYNVNYNVFHRINSNNGSGLRGITYDATTTHNILSGYLASNNQNHGFLSREDSDNNTLTHATIVNSNSKGMDLAGSDNCNYSQLLVSRVASFGLHFQTSTSNRLSNVMLVGGADHAIYVSSDSTNAKFYDNLWVRDNLVPGNLTDECWVETSDSSIGGGATDCTPSGSDFTLSNTVGGSGAFVGSISTDNTNQDTNSLSGGGVLATNLISDWFGFDNWMRSWGKGTAPGDHYDTSNRGICSGSNDCAMWDWRLSSADTSGTLNVNGAFVAGDPCPASAKGSVTLSDQTIFANTYLVNAQELMFDGYGDDDTLCESHEHCIYSPNVGAYQGEGDLGSCVFDDDAGAVTDVTMYGYLTNGV
ncbi:MAG TPA: NosD domain-containing protein [Bdellovibrionota bacterium]|nr:NosD domain-containing protein [Bdellovibrionota bacterium]